ncbi:transcriptional regulator, TetR family [Lentzea xinjiangensis]|uniref:Transcriptional regulator, TetR family n=1 Tax=Lentzea xinjiangensis TaxID=402600 RepID=A0A1H9RJP1_9PSEU|nr:TetR/AcrR family transcriptional regulator [Lentzea xinjiangensis]SER72169.1 transcriptional regulator, TetR family [Lentzea xinjiangensis]
MGRTRPGGARAKVLEAASALFYRDGIHAVGVDTVAAEAGVTKAALYGNFGSKNGLVVAYLRERDRLWQRQVDAITAGCAEPRDRVLAVFDAYEAWVVRDDYRGCAFLNAASEFPDPADEVRTVVHDHKTAVRDYLRAQLERIEPRHADTLAEELMLLLEGATAMSVVSRSVRPFRTAKRVAAASLAAPDA